jgi:dolichyl-phosphate beta-glucosyltransferase
MTLSIIIPAFNEEKRLPRTLAAIQSYFSAPRSMRLHEVIVVDDGSADGTARVAKEWEGRLPVQVLRFDVNRGKGAVSRAGMLAAEGDLCLLYDADGATPIGEAEKLVAAMQARGADIAIGSRVLGGEVVTMSAHRRFIGRAYHALTAPLIPGIEDAACGCKLFKRGVAHDLFARQSIDRFAFDVEVLAIALARGYEVVEVSVRWTAIPDSRVRIVRDTLQMTWCVLTLFARRRRWKRE